VGAVVSCGELRPIAIVTEDLKSGWIIIVLQEAVHHCAFRREYHFPFYV
jgi:hypothetical protein